MMTEKLLSCPFCGGEKNLESRHCDYGTKARLGKPWLVGCRDCNVYISIHPSEARVKGYKSARELAEAKWNRRADGWIPVTDTDRLPENEKMILAAFPDGFVCSVTADDYGDWALWAEGGEPTHWMPLPQPPKGAVNDD